MTAITIITFGTSQIDLFATKISAINDPTADNSIGNVVAANAIGVFLGKIVFFSPYLMRIYSFQGLKHRLNHIKSNELLKIFFSFI